MTTHLQDFDNTNMCVEVGDQRALMRKIVTVLDMKTRALELVVRIGKSVMGWGVDVIVVAHDVGEEMILTNHRLAGANSNMLHYNEK
jgi:hypothetical protein